MLSVLLTPLPVVDPSLPRVLGLPRGLPITLMLVGGTLITWGVYFQRRGGVQTTERVCANIKSLLFFALTLL